MAENGSNNRQYNIIHDDYDDENDDDNRRRYYDGTAVSGSGGGVIDLSSTGASTTNQRSNGGASVGATGTRGYFNCLDCNATTSCFHKLSVASNIWINPQHFNDEERTANELQSLEQSDRALVWSDLSANPIASGTTTTTTSTSQAGSTTDDEDDPTFMEHKLIDLDVELSKLLQQQQQQKQKTTNNNSHDNNDNNNKIHHPLEYVIEMNPQYVNSKSVKLRFLRADRFIPKDAAKRILNHFELKAELFPSNKDIWCRDVQLTDLTIEEQNEYNLVFRSQQQQQQKQSHQQSRNRQQWSNLEQSHQQLRQQQQPTTTQSSTSSNNSKRIPWIQFQPTRDWAGRSILVARPRERENHYPKFVVSDQVLMSELTTLSFVEHI